MKNILKVLLLLLSAAGVISGCKNKTVSTAEYNNTYIYGNGSAKVSVGTKPVEFPVMVMNGHIGWFPTRILSKKSLDKKKINQ